MGFDICFLLIGCYSFGVSCDSFGRISRGRNDILWVWFVVVFGWCLVVFCVGVVFLFFLVFFVFVLVDFYFFLLVVVLLLF